MRRLQIHHRTVRFASRRDAAAESKLHKLLLSQEKNTQEVVIECPGDILLDSDGLLQGKYRLTAEALNSIAAGLLSHFTKTLRELAEESHPTHRSADSSTSLAIKWFNELARLRHGRLAGRRLIVDRKSRTVEGLVGPSYKMITNLSVLTTARESAAADFGKDAVFHEAAVCGRWVMIRYAGPSSFRVTTLGAGRDTYVIGYSFANNEVRQYSLLPSVAVIRRRCGGQSISKFTRYRQWRRGRPTLFVDRFRKTLDLVRMRASELDALRSGAERMTQTKLGLGGDKDAHKKRYQYLTAKLVGGGLSSGDAVGVLNRALYYGSCKATALGRWHDPQVVFARRTCYDLFVAMLHVSRRLPIGRREKVEQAAYCLLDGSFNWR